METPLECDKTLDDMLHIIIHNTRQSRTDSKDHDDVSGSLLTHKDSLNKELIHDV